MNWLQFWIVIVLWVNTVVWLLHGLYSYMTLKRDISKAEIAEHVKDREEFKNRL